MICGAGSAALLGLALGALFFDLDAEDLPFFGGGVVGFVALPVTLLDAFFLLLPLLPPYYQMQLAWS